MKWRIQQTLQTAVADTRYTLSVRVANPIDYDEFGLTGFPGYRVELVADAEGAGETIVKESPSG